MSYPESLAAVPPILVYDVDSDLVVAIQRTVHTYDVDTDTWTRNANAPTALADKFNVRGIYDPVSGLIVVRDTLSSEMWAYNVDTDVWTPLRQGTLSPPGRDQAPDTALANTVYGQVHAYDAGTDRILLYLTDNHSGPGVWEGMGTEMTWAYDLRAGEWTIEDTVTPELNFGWIVGPGKTTYDETARATLVVADGVVAGYDAGSNEWGLLWENSSGPTVFGTRTGPHNRVDHAIVYDPTNQRVIVIGGSARMLEEDPFWVPMDDVWAFDTDTGTWLEILASSAP